MREEAQTRSRSPVMAFVPAAEHSHRYHSGRAVITSCLGCDLKMKCVCVRARALHIDFIPVYHTASGMYYDKWMLCCSES